MEIFATSPVNFGDDEILTKSLQRYMRGGTEVSRDQTRKILAWLIFTPPTRQLKMKELQHIMALRDSQPVPSSEETRFLLPEYELLNYVSDFVDFSPTTGLIDFAHKSIRDFLVDPRTRNSYFGTWEPRNYLVSSCLQYLSDSRVFIRQPFDRRLGEKTLKARQEMFPFASYADELWALHAKGDPEKRISGRIVEFLEKGPHITSVEWFQYVDVHKNSQHTFPLPRYGQQFEKQDTPQFYSLCVAVFYDLRFIVQSLKTLNCKVQLCDSLGCNVLHVAAYRGHGDVIKNLVALWGRENMEALVNGLDSRGATPLHYACDERFEKVAALLLDMGSRSDGSTMDNGENAFYCAVVNHLTSIVMKMFLKDPQISRMRLLNGSTTALHIAVKLGYVDMVETLLGCKPDLRATDSDGKRVAQLAESNEINTSLLKALDEENEEMFVELKGVRENITAQAEV